MKKIILILLINLLTVTWSFSENIYPILNSDSTVIITYQQLKKTNLVFLECDKLREENKLLNADIDILEKTIRNLNKMDSLNLEKYNNSIHINNELLDKNEQLQYELSKKTKFSNIKNYIIAFLSALSLVLALK